MKRILVLIFLGAFLTARADHITGGEMFYTITGASNGMYNYHVTLKQFRSCSTPNRQFYNPCYISIFNKATGERVKDIAVPLTNEEQISATSNDPCITRAPFVCYYVGYWIFDISLPATSDGYVLTSQVTFRVDLINNLVSGYGRIGATYTAEIPGTQSLPTAPKNNSARFTGSDLVTVCAQNPFSYSFAAEDPDGDQLRYSFCEAYQTTGYSGGGTGGNNSRPPVPPPYASVPYGAGYGGGAPLGGRVTINPNTGLISGIAPETGIYVVTVCVQEIRNGVAIATQRKDLQINITGCTVAAASLLPEYMLCGNSQQLMLANQSNSPLIAAYYWEFKNSAGNIVYSSTNPVADHTFTTPGTYSIKLATNRGLQCPDSTTSKVLVYPGFRPDFAVTGGCINKPALFTDESISVFGTVNYWDWDFGDLATMTDFSSLQNPSYAYSSGGSKTARLIVHNTVGCKDTLFKTFDIIDKPPITLSFRDTLICPPDRLQLNAAGNGVFTWSPNRDITGTNTAAPVVTPAQDVKYYVDINLDGCRNRDSVTIRTVGSVSLSMPADTVICRGDPIRLRPVSNGLRYVWVPVAGLSDPGVREPVVTTTNTTTYTVTASISRCTATGSVTVNAVPYPRVSAGPDTTICFNTFANLHAETDGSSYTWQMAGSSSTIPSLNAVVRPPATSTYIFTAYDTKGCPKPSRDTIIIAVLPQIHAYAGRDTVVVPGQPLQLSATGGLRYTWSPATGLSSPFIANPVAIFQSFPGLLRYKVLVENEAGCADSAFLSVKVYNTLPQVFVPTAFTPNGDGINDLLRPTAAGIREIEYFMVYNRWGQLVYSGRKDREGWDGRINGVLQSSGVYVWQVKAVDYLGNPFFKSGTATLLR